MSQFSKARDLISNKIFVTGPPVSGTTFMTKKLSKYYNIPLINQKCLVEFFKDKQNEIGEELRTFIEEERENQRALMQEKLDKLRAQGRTKQAEINEDEIRIEMKRELVCKMLQSRLKEYDCQTRGYVIDEIIQSYQEAQQIFEEPKLNEEGEQTEEVALNKSITPNSVIFISTSFEYSKFIY